MTTSIYRNTVSPDLIVTTPEQLNQAFKLWFDRFNSSGEEYDQEWVSEEDAPTEAATYLVSLLAELNGGA